MAKSNSFTGILSSNNRKQPAAADPVKWVNDWIKNNPAEHAAALAAEAKE